MTRPSVSVYQAFAPGYALHEVSHYLCARALGETPDFRLDEDGRPWVDVGFDPDTALWRAVLVGLAPVATGLLFLVTFAWTLLGPLTATLSWGSLVHVYLLACGVVWASPSEEDLLPLRILLRLRRD